MRISVVIPTYNRAQTLSRALSSVLCQSLQPYEIIVADDGSQDGTDDLVRRDYPQVVGAILVVLGLLWASGVIWRGE